MALIPLQLPCSTFVKPLNQFNNKDDLNNYYNVYFNDYGKMYKDKIIEESI